MDSGVVMLKFKKCEKNKDANLTLTSTLIIQFLSPQKKIKAILDFHILTVFRINFVRKKNFFLLKEYFVVAKCSELMPLLGLTTQHCSKKYILKSITTMLQNFIIYFLP